MVKIQVVRRFLLFLPTSYNESNSNPAPLLIDFHGFSPIKSNNKLSCLFITLATNYHQFDLAVGEGHQVARRQTFVSCQRRKDFCWLVQPSSTKHCNALSNYEVVLECWHRWQAKAWVTLRELPMHLAGGVGMCHRFLSKTRSLGSQRTVV